MCLCSAVSKHDYSACPCAHYNCMPLSTSSSNWHCGGGTKNRLYSTKQAESIKVGSYDLKFGQSQTDVGVIIKNTAHKLVTLAVVQ